MQQTVRRDGKQLPEPSSSLSLRNVDSAVPLYLQERDSLYCWDLRDELCRHFLEGEFITGEQSGRDPP